MMNCFIELMREGNVKLHITYSAWIRHIMMNLEYFLYFYYLFLLILNPVCLLFTSCCMFYIKLRVFNHICRQNIADLG